MTAPNWLIDTNILIGLEDDHVLKREQSKFAKLAMHYGVTVKVHQSGQEDIARDTNSERRAKTQSKYEKYPMVPSIGHLQRDELAKAYGPISKDNDEVDCRHLHALSLGVVQALVTEDAGIHSRAQKYAPEIANSVFRLAQAVNHLETLYGEQVVGLRHVTELDAHQINLGDPIFDSLREGYPAFDNWWKTKCIAQQRKCWVVTDNNDIAGVLVRKDETGDDTDAQTKVPKILKICTFKVREESRGHSLGEHLLKQALWHAQRNQYDLAYVTAYPKHQALIGVLELYGFENTYSKSDGELVFEKRFSSQAVIRSPTDNLAMVYSRYPRFAADKGVKSFGVPIKEPYHDILFPELNTNNQQSLFAQSPFQHGTLKPGNTIRKVYICKAKSGLGPPGSLLFFYKGKSDFAPSQAMTAIGILESVQKANSTEELVVMTGGRSVYSHASLEGFSASSTSPVKVINFLLGGYLNPAVDLARLKDIGVIKTDPQQSIYSLSNTHSSALLDNLSLGFDVL